MHQTGDRHNAKRKKGIKQGKTPSTEKEKLMDSSQKSIKRGKEERKNNKTGN